MGVSEDRLKARQKASGTSGTPAGVLRFRERQKAREKARKEGLVPAPPRADSRSGFQKLFSEEIGGASNIIGLFNQNRAENLHGEDIARQERLRRMFKTTTNPETKERLRSLIEQEFLSDPSQIFSDLVPHTGKTQSQVVGEILSLGLLAAPTPGAKILAKPGVSLVKKGLVGAVGGGAFGAALGLAQEGELAKTIRDPETGQITHVGLNAQKLQTIALMSGVGFIGGGILTGVLPAIVRGVRPPMKAALDKMNLGRFKGNQDTNVILPVVRETTQRTETFGKLKAQPTKGLTGIDREVISKQTKLFKAQDELDSLLLDDVSYLTAKTGVEAPTAKGMQAVTQLTEQVVRQESILEAAKKTLLSNPSQANKLVAKDAVAQLTKLNTQKKSAVKVMRESSKTAPVKTVEQLTKDKSREVGKATKELAQAQKKQAKLADKSVFNQLKEGDTVYSDDKGRFKLIQFMPDIETGKTIATARDFTGRPVTLTADDLLEMQKVTRGQEEKLLAFDNLAEVGEVVEQGNAQRILNGLRKYTKTTSKFLNSMGNSGRQLNSVLSAAIDGGRLLSAKEMEPMIKLTQELGLTKKKPLSNEQVKNIVDILDTGLRNKLSNIDDVFLKIKPIDEVVEQITRQFSKTTKGLVNRADKLGLKVKNQGTGVVHPIGEARVHYPRILKDVDKFTNNREEIIALQMKRYGSTREEATRLVSRFEAGLVKSRYAGLEQARTIRLEGFDELEKFGFEVNPLSVLEDFVEGASRRTTEANMFGGNDELISRLIDNIRKEGYDSSIAEEIFNRYVGKVLDNQSARAFLASVRAFETVASLPLAVLANATQLINTATLTGLKPLMRTFGKYMVDKQGVKEAGRLSGVSDRMIMSAAQITSGQEKVTTEALRNFFFTNVETFNRNITAAATRTWAEDSLTKLLKNPNNPKLIRNLEHIVPNLKGAIKEGKFTEDQLREIGLKGINQTQFRGSVLDIPLFWSSDSGKVMVQFKSFAWQQGNFVNDVIIRELKHGNVHPLVTYLTLSQLGGEAVRDIKDMMKGDFSFRQDEHIVRRMLENFGTVGGFGLMAESFNTFYEVGRGNFFASSADIVSGPAVGDAVAFTDGASRAVGGDPDELIKLVGRKASAAVLITPIRKIPGSGVFLRVMGDLLANMATD